MRTMHAVVCNCLMDALREKGLLCDCVLIANDDQRFGAHKSVLAACSPYLRALFMHDQPSTESESERSSDTSTRTHSSSDSTDSREVYVDVHGQLLETVLTYAYGRSIRDKLNFWDVETLMPLADRWNMCGIMTECALFLLDNMSPDNCVGIWTFARAYNCTQLEQSSKEYILYNVHQVCSQSVEWYRLEANELVSFINDDYLNVTNEQRIFNIICLWITALSDDSRLDHFSQLVNSVRWGLCNVAFIRDTVLSHPQFKAHSDLRRAIEQSVEEQRTLYLNRHWQRPRVPTDVLVAVGGWSEGAPTGAIESYDCKADRWFVLSDKTDVNPRAYHAMVVIGHKLYVVGGFDGSEYYNSVRCFDAETGVWKEAAPMYVARCYVSAAELNGQVYAVGGFDGRVRLNSAERYEPTSNQWSLIEPMVRARSDASACAHNGKLYVAGGFNGEDVLRSVEIYTPETDSWQQAAEMASPRSGLSMIAHQHVLYVVGGFDGQHRLNGAERYDRDLLRWIPIANMHTARSNFAIAVLDQYILAIGGFNGNTTVAQVERYSAESGVWEPVCNMNLNRSAVKAAVIRRCPDAIQYSYHRRHNT